MPKPEQNFQGSSTEPSYEKSKPVQIIAQLLNGPLTKFNNVDIKDESYFEWFEF